MAGIDREWRQDREDLVEEALAQGLVMLGDLGVVDDMDPLQSQGAPQLDEDVREFGDEFEYPFPGGRELFRRRPPVGRSGDGARLDLLTQAGDTDLEELVEVASEDRRRTWLARGVGSERRGLRTGHAR